MITFVNLKDYKYISVRVDWLDKMPRGYEVHILREKNELFRIFRKMVKLAENPELAESADIWL